MEYIRNFQQFKFLLSGAIHINNWEIVNTTCKIKPFQKKNFFNSHIAQSRSWYVVTLTNVAKTQISHHRLLERSAVEREECCIEQEICKSTTSSIQLTMCFCIFKFFIHLTLSLMQLNKWKIVVLATFPVTELWAVRLRITKKISKKNKKYGSRGKFYIWMKSLKNAN